MNRRTLLTAGLAGAATIVAAFAATAAEAACQRHIYNRSAKPWEFIASPRKDRGGERYGNVYFHSTDCRGMTNGPCIVAPGASVRITYTTTNGTAAGSMAIFDHKKKLRSFDYEGSFSRCPKISHRGNTGSVAVNDPANGDWNAWADQW